MTPEWQVISLEVTCPTKDRAIPRAFAWEGRRLRITDLGRSWEAEDGYHRLVRVADGRTFELAEQAGTWRACVRSTPPAAI
ncbi:MAG: hypothetical protein JXN59_08605 [Anaerolineae bacterium]|nr:hypothetical protein [Anaerolineae bacterium]